MTPRVVTAHIPEALADMRAGRVVEHATIDAWAKSLEPAKATKRRKRGYMYKYSVTR